MENVTELTLGEIVRHNYKAASILEKFNLDFCCLGSQNFNDACKAGGVESAVVLKELQQAQDESEEIVDFDALPLDELVDYICKRHHAYVEEKTPKLKLYLDTLVRVHGATHPELKQVRDLFYEIGSELIVHMKKEELMLFPFIRKLQLAKKNGTPASSPLFSSVVKPVEMMMDDHSTEGKKFRDIRVLTKNYQLPADACNTYGLTYQLLKEYEEDLHLHIHLENNILFPKAVALEREQR
jgi:regulator of cell morphogenesis and NO signaling